MKTKTYINFSFELIYKYRDALHLVYDERNQKYIIFGMNLKTLSFSYLRTAKSYFFEIGYDMLLNDIDYNTWYEMPTYGDFCKMFCD